MPAFRENDASLLHLELQALPRGTAVGEVLQQLTTLLTKGDLVRGSRLPPERQIAESLGVGRSAVREALAALEILGIVTVRPGSGTYLRESTSELLPTTLSWGLWLDSTQTRDLIEVRSGLEVQAVTLAAARIGDDDLDALRGYVDLMAENLDDFAAFVEADALFHLQIATSSGNLVLRDLLQTVRSLLRLWVERALQDRQQALDALREHRSVLDALERRDPADAEAAMKAHMKTAGDRVSTLPEA